MHVAEFKSASELEDIVFVDQALEFVVEVEHVLISSSSMIYLVENDSLSND